MTHQRPWGFRAPSSILPAPSAAAGGSALLHKVCPLLGGTRKHVVAAAAVGADLYRQNLGGASAGSWEIAICKEHRIGAAVSQPWNTLLLCWPERCSMVTTRDPHIKHPQCRCRQSRLQLCLWRVAGAREALMSAPGLIYGFVTCSLLCCIPPVFNL